MRDSETNGPAFVFEEGLQGILEYKPKEWIIPKLIPQGPCLSGIVGPSGSGKTFFVYDILMNYLIGATQWFNFPMLGDNRNCVLLTSEGDYKRRLLGWLYNRGISNLEEAHTEGKLLILDPSKCSSGIAITNRSIDPLIESIMGRLSSVGLIVIDTLNGFYYGNENDNSDMGLFLNHVNRLSQELYASTMIIHHTGKNKQHGQHADDYETDNTGRGASAFNAKLDMNIGIEGKPLTGIIVKTTKARDSAEGLSFKLTGKIVPLPSRSEEEGEEPETTIVLDSLEPLTSTPKRPKEDKDIALIQEGITAGLIPVEEGLITREDLTEYFTSHGGKDGTGFKGGQGNTGALNQTNPKGTGLCSRLMKKQVLEWIGEREGFLLTDTDSYCWKW